MLAGLLYPGEEQLLRYYHRQLSSLLSDADAAAYPFDTAKRHYQLCLLDYGRVVMSCFCASDTATTFQSALFGLLRGSRESPIRALFSEGSVLHDDCFLVF